MTKEIRDEIVPLNRKYGIEQLLEACAAYPGANNARRITFEYVMLKDKNDSDEDARELVRLIRQYRLAGQGQSDPVQPVARRGLRMLEPTSGSGRSAISSSKRAFRRRCARRAGATSTPPAASSRRPPRRSGGAGAEAANHAFAGAPGIGAAGPVDLQRPLEGREAHPAPPTTRSSRPVRSFVASMAT